MHRLRLFMVFVSLVLTIMMLVAPVSAGPFLPAEGGVQAAREAAQPELAIPATTLGPVFDQSGPGLSFAKAGVGLEGSADYQSSRSGTLTVNIGGAVSQAWLYWAIRDRPCPISGGHCAITSNPYRGQRVNFSGNSLFRFTGAGLLVIYTNNRHRWNLQL